MSEYVKYVTPFEPNLLYSGLVILSVLSIITLIIVTTSLVYGHTFSENENSLFLTRMDQASSQLKFIQNLLASNTSSSNNPQNNAQIALAHVKEAAGLLKVKDPINNFTWTQEIAERNQRVATDLVRGFNDLTATLNHETSLSKNNSNISSASGGLQSIQDKIFNLSGLLDEAISARVAKDIISNSTNQALVLSNLGNEIFYSYGQALGNTYQQLADMVATMNMSAMNGNSINMHTNAMMQGMSNMNTNGNQMRIMSNKVNIVNETDYQNALAYVKQSREIVSKYLTSPSPTIKTSSANVQSQLNKILSQLETAIINKSSFDSVMNLVHVQLHPTLISNYGLKLATPISK